MTKEFYSIEEIEKYYDKETNTYVFEENGEYIDLVVFNFDLDINAHIYANSINAHNINAHNINASDIDAWDITVYDINAHNINAYDINAEDIDAWNIDAWDITVYDINADDINAHNIDADNISYHAVCFAYSNIFCNSIKGRRENAKHFVLDGVLEVEE